MEERVGTAAEAEAVVEAVEEKGEAVRVKVDSQEVAVE